MLALARNLLLPGVGTFRRAPPFAPRPLCHRTPHTYPAKFKKAGFFFFSEPKDAAAG
jgi:hypothetical protein